MSLNRTMSRSAAVVLAMVVGGVTAACGGGNSSPTSPSGGNSGGPGPVAATLTIAAGGVNPASLTINVGQSITVVNNDSKAHQISSNPHPVHTDCPALNIGQLNPGQSRTSNAFTEARTCGFHDHDDPTNAAWMGQLTIR